MKSNEPVKSHVTRVTLTISRQYIWAFLMERYYTIMLVMIHLKSRENVSVSCAQDLKSCHDSENAVYLANMDYMPTHMLSFIKKSKGIVNQLKK